MRALVQRVTRAAVRVAGRPVAAIGPGLLVLVGVEEADGAADVGWLAGKIARIRIFDDGAGRMDRSLAEVSGEVLVVSQFTLHASTRKGNRPSFIRAARPEAAAPLCVALVEAIARESGRPARAGEFGAHMEVELVNDGPVTIWIDSRTRE